MKLLLNCKLSTFRSIQKHFFETFVSTTKCHALILCVTVTQQQNSKSEKSIVCLQAHLLNNVVQFMFNVQMPFSKSTKVFQSFWQNVKWRFALADNIDKYPESYSNASELCYGGTSSKPNKCRWWQAVCNDLPKIFYAKRASLMCRNKVVNFEVKTICLSIWNEVALNCRRFHF